MDLVKAEVERVIATVGEDYAVVISTPEKSFLIFVGRPEAVWIYRELKGIESRRPLTHDLIRNLLTAFDITTRMVAISSIVDGLFCATLLLKQETSGEERNEVRVDLRASDAMIVALKTKAQLWITREVLDQVADQSDSLPETPDPEFDD